MLEISERLQKQLRFIEEIDRMKHILRQTLIMDGSRRENDAEHSWHIAVMAIILQEYFIEKVDLGKTLQMLLIHDLVEIDAGDTFGFDQAGHLDKREREVRAAERIFGLLPSDQRDHLRDLWEEYETGETAEARFALIMDRLQPLLHNYRTKGHTWVKHGVNSEAVYERNAAAFQWAPELGRLIVQVIKEAQSKGELL